MTEGGFIFVEGVKLAEPEYPKGVKLTEPDLPISSIIAFAMLHKVFVYTIAWNSLQTHYNDSQYHIPEPYYYLVKRYIIIIAFTINKRDAYTLLESRRGGTGRRCCMHPKF